MAENFPSWEIQHVSLLVEGKKRRKGNIFRERFCNIFDCCTLLEACYIYLSIFLEYDGMMMFTRNGSQHLSEPLRFDANKGNGHPLFPSIHLTTTNSFELWNFVQSCGNKADTSAGGQFVK